MENLFNEEMWNSPEEFKDLSNYKYIAIDLETKDPNLKKMGSGSVRGDGAIIGVAVAVDGWSGYYSFGHEQGNFFAKEAVMKWVKISALYRVLKYFIMQCMTYAGYDHME